MAVNFDLSSLKQSIIIVQGVLFVFALFNLQDTVFAAAVRLACSLYHSLFRLSSTFFKVFQTFSSCSEAIRCRQLFYSITSSQVCQVLFSKFFKLFEVVSRCPPVLCALIRQLAYDNTSCSICQALFYKFLHFLLVVFTSGHLSTFPGFFWTNRS